MQHDLMFPHRHCRYEITTVRPYINLVLDEGKTKGSLRVRSNFNLSTCLVQCVFVKLAPDRRHGFAITIFTAFNS